MRIGVVGGGVVGTAVARSYLEHVAEVRVYDVLPERATHSLEKVLECDLVFIALPTPQKPGSLECDTSVIEEFFRGNTAWETGMDGKIKRQGNFVLRSTVPIGTTRRLREQYDLPNLVHSPEFLTARVAVTDAQLPARNIIGVPSGIMEETCPRALLSLYKTRFPGVPVHVMTSDESEAVKLFQNSFFATKLAYWNECRCLADKLNLDWGRVMEGVLSDGRIAHSHCKVPGPDGRGFAGSCLPKDLANLITCMRAADVAPVVTYAAHHRNKVIDRPEGA